MNQAKQKFPFAYHLLTYCHRDKRAVSLLNSQGAVCSTHEKDNTSVERERKKQRKRDRERETEKERKRKRDRERETEKERQRKRDREIVKISSDIMTYHCTV
jgi:hypothetical protein